jgi:hypothetical protein
MLYTLLRALLIKLINGARDSTHNVRGLEAKVEAKLRFSLAISGARFT